MSPLNLTLPILLAALAQPPATSHELAPRDTHSINAVLQDSSWSALHDVQGLDDADEVTRIRTHLYHVIDELSAASTTHLSSAQLERRERLIIELTDYANAGVFPARQPGDGFDGRRPRFIDHRGVHCAVGELVQRSGHAHLASSINQEHEFSYVYQIDEPGLLAWARHAGFSVRELAMIQPSYSSPPQKESVLRSLERVKSDVTVTCGESHAIPKSMRVSIQGDESGTITITAPDKNLDGFERCFIDKMTDKVQSRGGAWRSRPIPFEATTTVEFDALDHIVAERLKTTHTTSGASQCFPRPGALSKLAHIHVRGDDRGTTLSVRTEPRNTAIEACLTESFAEHVLDFGPTVNAFDFSIARELEPLHASHRLEQMLRSTAPRAASECHVKGAPETLNVAIASSVEAQRVDVTIGDGTPEFKECLKGKLDEYFDMAMRVSRQLEDGSYERYWRVDADAAARVDFDVITPEEQARRDEEIRKQMEIERSKFY